MQASCQCCLSIKARTVRFCVVLTCIWIHLYQSTFFMHVHWQFQSIYPSMHVYIYCVRKYISFAPRASTPALTVCMYSISSFYTSILLYMNEYMRMIGCCLRSSYIPAPVLLTSCDGLARTDWPCHSDMSECYIYIYHCTAFRFTALCIQFFWFRSIDETITYKVFNTFWISAN